MSRLNSVIRMTRPPEAWAVAHVPFMLLATRRRNDKLYVWVVADASPEEATKYRSVIKRMKQLPNRCHSEAS